LNPNERPEAQGLKQADFQPDPALYRLQPWFSMLALAADWGLIALALAGAMAWPQPLAYVLAAIIIARSQLALAVMMHEAAHGVLLPWQWLNDALAQALAAGPLFLSLAGYRAGHLKHHQAPMVHDDPVAMVFGINDYPVSRRRLFGRLLADLAGVSYCISAWRMARGDYRDILPVPQQSAGARFGVLVSILLANGLLFGILASLGHPWLYPALWLLPAITLLPFMGRIRAIMEHAGLPACDDQRQNARTIIRPSWQTFLFGPHAIHYHIEHHLYVRLPFYRLAAVHRQMAARQLLPAANVYRGYGAILRDVTYSSSSEPRP